MENTVLSSPLLRRLQRGGHRLKTGVDDKRRDRTSMAGAATAEGTTAALQYHPSQTHVSNCSLYAAVKESRLLPFLSPRPSAVIRSPGISEFSMSRRVLAAYGEERVS